MKIFEVLPDEDEWADSDIDASHVWTLPGVDCPICGCWGTTGLSYPAVETPELNQNTRKGRWPVSLHEYKIRADPMRSRLLATQIIVPGAEFGPLVGKAIGPIGDFAWVHSWFLLVRDERLNELKHIGFKSPVTTPPDLMFQRERANLLEFGIDPLASWDIKALKNAYECELCGFFRDGLPEGRYPTVLRSSVPTHVEIFRVRQAPAIILCTESFVEKVTRLKLSNIKFQQMRVS